MLLSQSQPLWNEYIDVLVVVIQQDGPAGVRVYFQCVDKRDVVWDGWHHLLTCRAGRCLIFRVSAILHNRIDRFKKQRKQIWVQNGISDENNSSVFICQECVIRLVWWYKWIVFQQLSLRIKIHWVQKATPCQCPSEIDSILFSRSEYHRQLKLSVAAFLQRYYLPPLI